MVTWTAIRVVSCVTTGFKSTLFHPQNGLRYPVPPPIPDVYRLLDCNPTSSSVPGCSTLPSFNQSEHVTPFLPTQYDTTSSVRAVRVSLHFGTPLIIQGVSPRSSSPRIYGGVPLYSLPPRVTSRESLHTRVVWTKGRSSKPSVRGGGVRVSRSVFPVGGTCVARSVVLIAEGGAGVTLCGVGVTVETPLSTTRAARPATSEAGARFC